MQNHRIIIAGAGGIGRAVGLLMANYPEIHGEIFIGDRNLETAREAAQWIEEGRKHPIDVHPFPMQEHGFGRESEAILADADIILDCLPGALAPEMARVARRFGLHYANLTEYVAQTKEIVEIAKGADTGFVLQTGLAPGFINILAHKLFYQFRTEYNVEKVEHIKMRVGALTKHTQSPHFYGFTWSPIGVATEYIKNSIVVRNYEKVALPALSDRETLLIDGIEYEADLTSGGCADLADVFEGVSRSVDYKTIRYPNHFAWVESILESGTTDEDRINRLEQTMLNHIPAVEDDVIIIYCTVIGRDQRNRLRSIEKSYRIYPCRLGGKKLRAIQSTTAAPLAECARMLLAGKWKGVVFQSQIDPDEFLSGPFVSFVYGKMEAEMSVESVS